MKALLVLAIMAPSILCAQAPYIFPNLQLEQYFPFKEKDLKLFKELGVNQITSFNPTQGKEWHSIDSNGRLTQSKFEWLNDSKPTRNGTVNFTYTPEGLPYLIIYDNKKEHIYDTITYSSEGRITSFATEIKYPGRNNEFIERYRHEVVDTTKALFQLRFKLEQGPTYSYYLDTNNLVVKVVGYNRQDTIQILGTKQKYSHRYWSKDESQDFTLKFERFFENDRIQKEVYYKETELSPMVDATIKYYYKEDRLTSIEHSSGQHRIYFRYKNNGLMDEKVEIKDGVSSITRYWYEFNQNLKD